MEQLAPGLFPVPCSLFPTSEPSKVSRVAEPMTRPASRDRAVLLALLLS